MTLYIKFGTSSETFKQKDKRITEWFEYIHGSTAPIDPDDREHYERNVAYVIAGSATGDRTDPVYPAMIHVGDLKHTDMLKDYIVLPYQETDVKTLTANLHEHLKDTAWMLIPDPEGAVYRLVVETSKPVDEGLHQAVAEHITVQLGVPSQAVEWQETLYSPYYVDPAVQEKAIFNTGGNKFKIEDIISEYTSQSHTDTPRSDDNDKDDLSTPLKEDALRIALNDFIANEEVQYRMNNEEDYIEGFISALALSSLNGTLTKGFTEEVIEAVGEQFIDPDELKERLDERKAYLKPNPIRQSTVEPITSYLPITEQFKAVKNLSQLFEQMLPDEFEPDPEMKPNIAGEIISRYFEFALLPIRGQSDADNVAIFNPLTGAWEHDENDLISIITMVKPGVTAMQLKTILMYWGANARRKNAVIKPYDKTGYLLFKNGALDLATMKLHPFSDPIIRRNQFTRRHKINIRWNPNPALKVFRKDRPDGGDWSIDAFVRGYSYDKPELTEYFLFGLSLGLFSGHNSSVHFDMQGKSRLGKTTLAQIFDNLFEGRIAIITYNVLNTPFPLTSYDLDTAIIWVKECNIGSEALNDEYGTPFYDGLADNQTRLPVKHSGDLIVDNPPQMFIDGTQFIQATEIHTGPAGRTLAFKLPDVTQEDTDKFYSLDISGKFQDEEVLQYLVFRMIQAFKSIVPEHRQGNFKMNLASKRDIELLPPEAQTWRHEFVNSDISIKTWFDDEVLPYLQTEEPLHIQVLHKMYLENVKSKSKTGNDTRYAQGIERFEKNVMPLFDEYGYNVDYDIRASVDKRHPNAKPRRTVKHPNDVAIDWQKYEEAYERPDELVSASVMTKLFNKKTVGWFELTKKHRKPQRKKV